MRQALMAVVLGFFGSATTTAGAMEDEPGFLGRIFRRGSSTPATTRRVDPATERERISAELLRPPADPDSIRPPTSRPSTPPAELVPAPANGDPLLARYAVGRATDGSTFGLFLQVYADGTVMDSSGLHHTDPARLEELREALAGLPVEQLDRHYPGPAAGDLEVIQLVVYRRSKGKIQAYPFSYSGEPSGAPDEVRRLHAALETFEMHLAETSIDPVPPTRPSRPAARMPAAGPYDQAPPPPLAAPR